MSNILIIKHGSLGDIAQISGVLKDIRENNLDKKIFILTTFPYVDLLNRCPHVDGVLIDKRLSRWNFFYLLKLRKIIKKYKFSYVYDLQNSLRTNFYKNFLFKDLIWSNTINTLNTNESKKNFNKNPVLERFKLQLEKSNLKIKYCLKPDFSWAIINVDQIVNKFIGKKFVLIFPFCSLKLSHKEWPHYNRLIKIIKNAHPNLEVVIAPGPKELEKAKKINAITITNNQKALNVPELAGLIKKSIFVVANDTGPAHMSAHLGKEGLVLFGPHTTPYKVSIETDKFKPISSKKLQEISPEQVYSLMKNKIT